MYALLKFLLLNGAKTIIILFQLEEGHWENIATVVSKRKTMSN
jgi:hypothetical protein